MSTNAFGRSVIEDLLDERTRMHRGRAVTLIQRFGSALNLNIHFHMDASHGNNLGPAPQARIQDRHRNL